MDWIIFSGIIILLLTYDLAFVGKSNQLITFRQTIYSTLFYISIACIFGIYIFFDQGGSKAVEYFSCFFIEKAMSLDNIFVISMIFQVFSIPLIYQRRILFWGILGVIIFRGIMIHFGLIVINKFSWLIYVFGVILILTGIKTFYISKEKFNIRNSYIYRFLQKYCNLTDEFTGYRYFIKHNGKIQITTIGASLIMIETMDAIFAIDSIPAIFAITNDNFIIYTSNIFAILGLRALFFCLANIVDRFSYIKYSLAMILIFIGIKIFIGHFFNIPSYLSLMVVMSMLIIGILVSIVKKEKKR